MQTMLPSVMRAKYQKAVIALDKNLQKQDLLQGQIMKILDNQLSTQMQKQLSLWQKNGLVEIKYLVKNQAKQLEQWFIQRQSYDYSTFLSQIKPQAKKQRQLLQLFIDNPKLKSISLKELLSKYHFT
ncbi:hypothetical protein EQ500_15210, partial [Lactobacillus sp. XV13L]|nr:hypothetical protein [Lactobacillus sp. XV13L]